MTVDDARACLDRIATDHGYPNDPQHNAFVVSFQVCSTFTVQEIAKEFKTSADRISAAEGFASQYSDEASQAALEGCLLALS